MALSRLTAFNLMTVRFTYRNLLHGPAAHNRRTFKTESNATTNATTVTNTKSDENNDENEPIQYSTSPAAQWAAVHSQRGHDKYIPWYQPHIVVFSLTCFLLYFGYFRQPNDIDEIFEMELGDHFPNLTEEQLQKKFGMAPDYTNTQNYTKPPA